MSARPARAAAAALSPVALLLSGCGGAAGDLMAIERAAPGTRGGPQRIVITGDGRGRCGAGGPARQLASATVIEARAIERELAPLAERAADYTGPAPRGDRFVARSRAGTVRWVGRSPRLPRVLPRAELLHLRVRRALCPPGTPAQ